MAESLRYACDCRKVCDTRISAMDATCVRKSVNNHKFGLENHVSSYPVVTRWPP